MIHFWVNWDVKLCVMLKGQIGSNECKKHRYSSSLGRHTATGTDMPYGVTRCYLPPGRGDIPVFTPGKLVFDLATPEGCKAELT